MSNYSYKITDYKYSQYSGDGWGGLISIIACFDNGAFRGNIRFVQNGTQNIQSSKGFDDTLQLMFHEERFSDIMSTLREESPVYITFDDKMRVGSLATQKEPIGEQEG